MLLSNTSSRRGSNAKIKLDNNLTPCNFLYTRQARTFRMRARAVSVTRSATRRSSGTSYSRTSSVTVPTSTAVLPSCAPCVCCRSGKDPGKERTVRRVLPAPSFPLVYTRQ